MKKKWIKPELIDMHNPRVAKAVRYVIKHDLPDKALMGIVLSMYMHHQNEMESEC